MLRELARRAVIVCLLSGYASTLSVGCAEEPDSSTGPRGGRGGASGRGPDGGLGGTSGSGGSSGSGGFAGSAGSGGGSAGSGVAGSGADAGTGGTAGASGTSGSSGSSGATGTGASDAGPDSGAGGTSGTSGTGGTAGTAGTAGTDGTAGSDAGPDASTGGTSGNGGTTGTGGDDAGPDTSVGGTAGTAGSAGTNGASGTAGVAGTDSSAGTGGTAGTGGADAGPDGIAGTGGVDAGNCNGAPNTAPGFVNLAPPMGAALDPAAGTPLNPPPPAGWTWYPIANAVCRDGSQAGFFVRFTTSDKLFIYLEGGGACTNFGFCNFNPPNVNSSLSGNGEIVIGSVFGVAQVRQQPGVFTNNTPSGIFDTGNSANPFRDWNGVYIPYCTGDVHSGTKTNGTVPGVSAPQQFVGSLNMQKFIGRIVPTFRNRVNRVIITGASAGSFGAALNYSMLQDAFGCVKVDALLDSGVPFTDTYMPVCMQQRWRAAWGLNAALPPDCTECTSQADGGGFIKYADFLIRKHPRATIAAVSSMQDEVIRLFFSMGLRNCAGYDTADPVGIVLGQLDPNVYYPAANYTAALNELKARYVSSGRFATYFLGGPNINFHQHTFRARFFDPAAGTKTIAAFTTGFLNGTIEQIGP